MGSIARATLQLRAWFCLVNHILIHSADRLSIHTLGVCLRTNHHETFKSCMYTLFGPFKKGRVKFRSKALETSESGEICSVRSKCRIIKEIAGCIRKQSRDDILNSDFRQSYWGEFLEFNLACRLACGPCFCGGSGSGFFVLWHSFKAVHSEC